MASPRGIGESPSLVGSGRHLHRLVEAAAVDAGYFGTHRPKVGRKLSAMMDAMVRDKREVGSCRQFEYPECGDDLGQLVR